MLLVADIGNTNITLGVFEGKTLLLTFRLTTKTPRTSDEYGFLISDIIKNRGYNPKDIDKAIISSVVPKVNYSFSSGIIKYFNVTPMLVEAGVKTGIKIKVPNPREVGSDRIVDAVAAYELYGGPLIVIDYGTATTFDLVSKDGEFLAGVTSPGVQTSAASMFANTAKLPEIEIVKPKSILAKDTITSMQAGLFYGCLGQTEFIIDSLKDESGLEGIKVVATGGLGKLISQNTDKIDYYDAELTLHGLRIIYEKNDKSEK